MATLSCLSSSTLLSISLFLQLLSLSLTSAGDSIHDVLRSRGLPPGLLPKAVKSFTLDDNGLLQVFLDAPCLAKYENRVFFNSTIMGNLSYGEFTNVHGLSQEELFLWLPVKDIIVDDPSSGLILFDIGVAHKQLALSLFEDPPDCKPQGEGDLSLRSGVSEKKMGRKEKLFAGL